MSPLSQQREPGLEHFGVEGGLDAFGLSALHVAAHLGEPGREPSDDMEPVQHMAGVAEVGVDGRLVSLGAVADHHLDLLAPADVPAAPKTLTAQPSCGARPWPGCGRCRR